MGIKLDILDKLREELVKSRRTSDTIHIDNLRKEETIRKLTEELKASQSLNASHFTVEVALNVIPGKRGDTIQTNRIQYENHLRTRHQADFS
jgi:hypothetical protein